MFLRLVEDKPRNTVVRLCRSRERIFGFPFCSMVSILYKQEKATPLPTTKVKSRRRFRGCLPDATTCQCTNELHKHIMDIPQIKLSEKKSLLSFSVLVCAVRTFASRRYVHLAQQTACFYAPTTFYAFSYSFSSSESCHVLTVGPL